MALIKAIGTHGMLASNALSPVCNGECYVHNVLPELATPSLERTFDQADVDAVQELVLARAGYDKPDEDSYEEAVMQVAIVGHSLLILDQEALEDEELLLVLQDKKGNVVK